MDIRQLKYFIAIAETESFSQASEKCCLTQSAISQQIKSLEDELHVTLFHRSTHKVKLSAEGMMLLPKARVAVRDFDAMNEEAKNINGKVSGTLNIGIGSFIEPYIRKAAALMLERYPDVKMNVVFDKASFLNRLLREHELDIAFTMNQARENEGIESEKVLNFHLSAIMRKSHRLAIKDKVTFDDLLSEKIILPDVGSRALQTVRCYYDVPLEKLNTVITVNNADAAINMIKMRNMITFLPHMYVNIHHELCAKPIEGLEMPLVGNCHWMKDCVRKKSSLIFLDIVRECSMMQDVLE